MKKDKKLEETNIPRRFAATLPGGEDLSRRAVLTTIAVVGGLIYLVFIPSRNYALLAYDSTTYTFGDSAIRRVDWEHVSFIFKSNFLFNYNPLQRVSYMFDWALWGAAPGGFRSTNILLHWIATCCVFLFFHHLTKRVLAAWFLAICFALHPTRVECVVWIAQRKDVLAAAFGFCSLWLYVLFRRARTEGSGHPVALYLTALAAYVGALASKAQWVPLCGVLVAIDLFLVRRIDLKRLAEHAPFFLLSGIFAWFAIEAQFLEAKLLTFPTVTEWVVNPLSDISTYVANSLWPVGLCIRVPRTAPNIARGATGLLILFFWTAAAFREWKRSDSPSLGFGLVWFLAFLSPMLNLAPGIFVASDRYLYIALLGLAFPLAFRLGGARPRFVWPILAVLVGVWGGLTLVYLPVWKSDTSLWSYATERVPKDNRAWSELALARLASGDVASAKAILEKSREIQPLHPIFFLVSAKLAKADDPDMTRLFLDELEKNPLSWMVRRFFIEYLIDADRFSEAEAQITLAWEISKRKYQSNDNPFGAELARVYLETNRPTLGIPIAYELTRDNPLDERLWVLLGGLEEKAGNLDRAEAAFRRALDLSPELVDPRFRLAILAFRRGEADTTITHLLEMRRELDGNPMPAPALNLLAAAYRKQGRLLPALVALTEATQTEDNPNYLLNLARLQVEAGHDPHPTLAKLVARVPNHDLTTDPLLSPFLVSK